MTSGPQYLLYASTNLHLVLEVTNVCFIYSQRHSLNFFYSSPPRCEALILSVLIVSELQYNLHRNKTDYSRSHLSSEPRDSTIYSLYVPNPFENVPLHFLIMVLFVEISKLANGSKFKHNPSCTLLFPT